MKYRSNVKNIIKILNENEERALHAVGILVRGEAQTRAPVDEGNLRDSIDYLVNDSRKSVIIGASAAYAPYVEYGTRPHFPPPNALKGWAKRHGAEGAEFLIARSISKKGTKAQPFLTPAFEDNKQNIKKLIARELGRRLK
ncbi:HK97-gp10 family putative phage morphogenesis protein [Thermoflavimicrobium dichotomicum]|uniref:Phage protein, HK97 gp10 family n=1 Tax=Thermoflavimicrobium dichotomicum TaxID=46223 RepID=A0A1I3UI99_9BACL|nr:HK97-gp10 family putative phage morphogenesis protein [Thermoflavimicrobium dichotomicum]SFJ83214.1 phage protein, HK97 gp10 family [Thermoflavimicrobium dichotomicum]